MILDARPLGMTPGCECLASISQNGAHCGRPAVKHPKSKNVLCAAVTTIQKRMG